MPISYFEQARCQFFIHPRAPHFMDMGMKMWAEATEEQVGLEPLTDAD